jgi:hypothetical protein
MIKLRIVLLFTSLLLVHQVECQENDLLELSRMNNYHNVIPSSPNAASLGKYGDIPVNLYTGVPSVNIPIFELTDRVINIPISLSYHASGIRMSELPGWVGAGWSLNTGGVISRSVIGRPDDLEIWGYFNNGLIPAPDEISSIYEDIFPEDRKLEIFKGIWDIQPDSYAFNFLGYSGKLIITNEEEKKAYTVPYNRWNISVIEHQDNGRIIGFKIITEDGTIYEFGGSGATELCRYTPTDCTEIEEVDYITAWYLKKISSPKINDEIIFSYVPVEDKTIESEFESRYLTLKQNYGVPGCDADCPAKHSPPCISTIRYTQILPGTIETESLIVNFFSEPAGNNDGTYKLDSIRITDNYSQETKSFMFDYLINPHRHFLKSFKVVNQFIPLSTLNQISWAELTRMPKTIGAFIMRKQGMIHTYRRQ